MTIERTVQTVAGTFVLVTLALGVEGSPIFHSVNWLWATTFVGANLFQAGLTGFCPMGLILKAAGMRSAADQAVR